MSPEDPRHGTYAGYVAHGKSDVETCQDCATAATRYRKVARLDVHRGMPRTVPIGPDAQRILVTATVTHLAQAAGIGINTIHRLRKGGPDQLVRRRVRDAILSARTPTAVGIQRRLRALIAIGYSMRSLGEYMGKGYADNLRSLAAREDVAYVRADFAAEIIAAYDELCMTPAPDNRGASRARNRALANGWLPPLAWDNIDDPDERPARPEKVDGRKTVHLIIEDAEWLADSDLSLSAACERLDINRDTFRDILRREGRSDLYWRLANREPDADLRRSVRDGIKRSREVA